MPGWKSIFTRPVPGKHSLKFEAQPPLREGQFLRSPVIHRPQALRALFVFTIACFALVLLNINAVQAATTQIDGSPLQKQKLVEQPTELYAQLDLTNRRRAAPKKKARSNKARIAKPRRTSNRTRARKPSSGAFRAYINALWPQARAMGVSRRVFDGAFAGVTLNRAVLRPARKQAEFVKPIWSYLSGSVSPQRINKGRAMLRQWSQTLGRIESRYGVDRYTVLAIWGMETNYGGYTGNQNVIRALASLAYAGIREDFFRKELLTALVILQQGHISARRMTGSWAGAMGQTQFMPSSFTKYAVDYNGDGAKNIWSHVPDALASTANYLAKFGWLRGVTWGYEVILPRNFNISAHDPRQHRPFTYWQSAGVRRADGRPMPTSSSAAIMFPAGRRGPVFLLTKNFDVIKEYNRSNAYALGVAHLSDRIAGMGALKGSWPRKQKQLSRRQLMEMQRFLNRQGYKAGKVDGRVGQNVTAAVRKFQLKRGIIADGYPTRALLQVMRKIR